MFDIAKKIEEANEELTERLDEVNSHLFTINENLEKLIKLHEENLKRL